MNILIQNYFVDTWSIVHLLVMSGLISYLIRSWGMTKLFEVIVTGLIMVYGWEVLEVIIVWIAKPAFDEPAFNRWVFDPLFGIMGTVLAYCYEEHMEGKCLHSSEEERSQ